MNSITPDLMAILSSKINGISRQMTYVLQKSARSSIISNARDFSTAVCDGKGEVIALPNGFPVHATNMGLTLRGVFEYHPPSTLKPGDAILNNSPYHGNTHMGDHTIIVPVFFEDEIMFYTTIRAHQADIGNSIPTTYHGMAKDIYEEGALCFPGVKIQKNYEDVEDIIRMCKMRIRVPDIWYGDYSAAVGAARIGEKELIKLTEKYGKETVKIFCREWQKYGDKKMEEEIKKIPSGTWRSESKHDPIADILPDGISVKSTVTVDQEQGKIIVDFTENGDPIKSGYNLCEATVLAAGRTAVLNCLSANDLPLCEGTFSRIEVKMKERGVIGKASFPYSSALATTSLFERAVFAAQLALSQAKEEFGMAEGSSITVPSQPVVSGFDSRYNRPFISQISSGISGGMAVFGHDGYTTFGGVCTGGLSVWNPFEVLEQKYPIQFEMQEIIPDSCGAGKWDGGPGTRIEMKMRDDRVRFVINCDNSKNPARGVKGGKNGRPIYAYRYKESDKENIEDITNTFIDVELEPKEIFISESAAGGGLGDPFERDPELIRHRVREGWLSLKKAKEVYGVVIDTTNERYIVNYEETRELRNRRVLK
ncbi:hydantoinase B/oxoprolinase family protein [Bacillus aerolatus]|uniref:Hydantoinase B/oxoprolinase family protein n=1 Tax=Bacillus aerolatus TaxID=2653354 RepID=A0A6I1FML0_9BACI|nr:hydantoinase B/oxoprolinase family protein [Bacillus aerolatus]KAB7708269.1 hydantoinase B/oxoprolinase family protein [Bacillus aerolatus]